MHSVSKEKALRQRHKLILAEGVQAGGYKKVQLQVGVIDVACQIVLLLRAGFKVQVEK